MLKISQVAIASFYCAFPLTPVIAATPLLEIAQANPEVQYQEVSELLDRGAALLNKNQLAEAQTILLEAVEKARSLQNTAPSHLASGALELERFALAYLSIIAAYQGNNEEALTYAQQELKIARLQNNAEAESRTLITIGDIYFELNQPQTAFSLYQESLKIARSIEDKILIVQASRATAILYYTIGDFEQGLTWANLSLAELQNTEFSSFADYQQFFLKRLEGEILGLLGSSNLMQNDLNKAFGYFEQQQQVTESLEVSDRVSALSNLGLFYAISGNFDRSIGYYQKALEIYQTGNSIDRQITGILMSSLSLSYAYAKKHTTALQLAQESYTIVRESPNFSTQGSALSTLGAVYYQSGNLSEAEQSLQHAIAYFEQARNTLEPNSLQQVNFLGFYTEVYELLQRVYLQQNRPEMALEIAEAGRSIVFNELLRSRQNTTDSNLENITIEEIKNLARSQNATLVEYAIIYDPRKALLPGRVTGLQADLEAELLIWVIQPNGKLNLRRVDLQAFRASQNVSLTELIERNRNALGAGQRGIASVHPRNPEQVQDSLRQLHQLLIEPITDLLPQKPEDRIIFVPQGMLFFVPFAALKNADSEYLIESHTVLSTPSLQTLKLILERPQTPLNLTQLSSENTVIVGNPTMPEVALRIGQEPQPLSSLPGAEREANEIASMLNLTPLIGDAATETRITQKLPQTRLIHLATHGLLDDFSGVGIPGAIALAPTTTDDGLLNAAEISNLNLSANLAILSACDTGSGRITGDGVIGLSRSLLGAGTQTIIVSLWAVPDAPTAFLMTEFYNQLTDNPDKAHALRQAMLMTMQQHPDPIDWAAFTLMGSPD
jgi:CHAT domain-containing protein